MAFLLSLSFIFYMRHRHKPDWFLLGIITPRKGFRVDRDTLPDQILVAPVSLLSVRPKAGSPTNARALRDCQLRPLHQVLPRLLVDLVSNASVMLADHLLNF